MSKPYLRGAIWWLRIAVPHPLRESAKGRMITLAVGDSLKPLKVGERITTSLYTSDKAQARQKAGQVRQQAEVFFDSLRGKRDPLTHKQRLAFVGEVRQQVIQFFDDDPGDPAQWDSVQSIGQRLVAGDLRSWGLDQGNKPVELSSDDALLQHYLPAIARVEAMHGIVLTDQERQLLVADLHRAMDDAARVNQQKASGDYSDAGQTTRYPELKVSPPTALAADGSLKWSFEAIIDREVARRSQGSDAKPLSKAAIGKYRLHTGRFACSRGSEDVRTITAVEGQRWLDALASDPKLTMSNKVRGEHLSNVKVVINYARTESLGSIFPNGNPLDVVRRPVFKPKPKGEATLTMAEAKAILLASRKESRPHIRWIPWLLAYSGSRVGEVAALTKEDFWELDGKWFYRLVDKGEGSSKTDASVRTVPVHPALVKEGLLEFIEGQGKGKLFLKSAAALLRLWVRKTAGVTRENVGPNHGWRHLFTDFARIHIEGDAAHRALLGRADKGSMGLYGNSEAMLPSLWERMASIAEIELGRPAVKPRSVPVSPP